MDADWSNLLPELIVVIARNVTDYVDYIRFRAVCVKWRSALSPTTHNLPCQLPWLMLTPEPHYGKGHGFFNLSDAKVYRLDMPNTRPWKRCCGSSHGWLVLLEKYSPTILLFNPFTSIEIQLPPITTFPNILDFNFHIVGKEYLQQSPLGDDPYPYRLSLDEMCNFFIKKVVLSSNPTSLDNNCVAVAIIGLTLELAFCKKGVEPWTIIEDPLFYAEDVICYKGLFYAVNCNGSLAICDFSGVSPLVKIIAPPSPVPPSVIYYTSILYLVDSFGELLLVNRRFCFDDGLYQDFIVYQTVMFDVFRLDSSGSKWVEVKSLGNRMLFLGTNLSLCLLATDFSGCEGNCIYFTGGYSDVIDDKIRINHDSGVFSLGDGCIKALPIGSQSLFFAPPVWLTPNPC